MGACKASACVYNSSSDDDGDEDKGESMGESKGFVLRRDSGAVIEKTPSG
jgi:hypothetical protein